MDSLKCKCHLLLGVRCHKAKTDERVVGRHCRRDHRIDEDSLVEQVTRDGERLVVVSDVKRDDGGLGVTDFKSHLAESVQRIVGDVPQVLLSLRLGEHDVECSAHSGSRCVQSVPQRRFDRVHQRKEPAGESQLLREQGKDVVCSPGYSDR